MWVVAETYECPAHAGLSSIPHAAPNASFVFDSEEGHGPFFCSQETRFSFILKRYIWPLMHGGIRVGWEDDSMLLVPEHSLSVLSCPHTHTAPCSLSHSEVHRGPAPLKGGQTVSSNPLWKINFLAHPFCQQSVKCHGGGGRGRGGGAHTAG